MRPTIKTYKGKMADDDSLEKFIKDFKEYMLPTLEKLAKDKKIKGKGRAKKAFDDIYTMCYLTALYKTPEEVSKLTGEPLETIKECVEAFDKEIELLTYILELKKEIQKITYGISNEVNRVLINAYLRDFHTKKYPTI